MHSSVAFRFTPYRIPFQLQIKFQGTESLSHSSGLAACSSSSLLSLLPVTLLKGVEAFPPASNICTGSTLSHPVCRRIHGVVAFSPQSAAFCTGSTLSPQSLLTLHGVDTFSPSLPTDSWEQHFLLQSAELCTGSMLSPPVC